MGNVRWGVVFFAAIGCFASVARASDEARIVVDDSPFLSSRGAGMAGALSTSADSVDAPYYNPACIGGCQPQRSTGSVRELYFPHVGGAVNSEALGTLQEMQKGGAATDGAVTRAVLDAHAGNRQYGRLSLYPGVVVGRLAFGPIVDQQVAALPASGDLVSLRSRSVAGFGIGTSVTDNAGRFHLGVFTSYLTRQEIAGDVNYLDAVHAETRSKTLKDITTRYSGQSMSVGMVWKLADRMEPTLGVAVRDMGDTEYQPSKDGAELLLIEQDMSVGFSVRPRMSSNSTLLWVVEATRLQQEYLAMNKKFRTGMEWAFWGTGSFARLAFRAGYNLAGVSAGMSVNWGVIMMAVASQAEDVGVGNAHLVERRYVATLSMNIAD